MGCAGLPTAWGHALRRVSDEQLPQTCNSCPPVLHSTARPGAHVGTDVLQVEREACSIGECWPRVKGPFPRARFSNLLSQESLEEAASVGETGAVNF